MSFKRKFFGNLIVSGGYNYFTQLINFLSSLVTARLLSPEHFGTIGLITVFSGFISIFSDGGISMSVVRSDYRGTYHRALHKLAISIGTGLCIISVLVMYPISNFYDNEGLLYPGIVLSFLFIVRSIGLVPAALLQKRLQFNELGRITLFSAVGSIFTVIVLGYLDCQYWALVGGQFVGATLTSALSIIRSHWTFSSSSAAAMKVGLQVTKGLLKSYVGFSMINYWSRNADNLLVGKYYGAADLGIYNRGYGMLTLPLNLITGLFSSVLYPSLVTLKKEGGNVQSEYYFVLKIISIINFPIGVLLICFPQHFVTVFWGTDWIEVSELLPYFGLLIMTQTLLSTVGHLLIIENKESVLMLSGAMTAFFVISGIVIGITQSLEGVAAFYSLFYIIGVLTTCIFHLYINTLKQPLGLVLKFWLPKIILSTAIWITVYYDLYLLQYLALFGWFSMLALDTKSEAAKLFGLILTRFRP